MAGTGDKKDNAGHAAPSSPMPQNGGHIPSGAVSQLTLDTTAAGGAASPIPQLARAASDLNRKNSNPNEWATETEFPFKGKTKRYVVLMLSVLVALGQ